MSKEIEAWFSQRLPEEWVTTPARVTVDREEITVLLAVDGPLASTEKGATAPGEAEQAQALAGYVSRWREQTRERRIGVAREAEHRFGRKVAW
jgi:hypothetical protein